MTDLSSSQGWVRTKDAERLPPPPNTTGVTGWLLQNLFNTPLNMVLTVVGAAFIAWITWGVIDWAIIRAVFTGENRDACVAGQATGTELGACWPYVGAKFHQFVYGFYPFDQRWRVNICFIVGAVALVTMLIPSLPYKKWNALFLLVAYPLMTFVLLTGGNLDLSSSTILGITGLLLLSTLVVPLRGRHQAKPARLDSRRRGDRDLAVVALHFHAAGEHPGQFRLAVGSGDPRIAPGRGRPFPRS
jgi:general L-amino acid transport system permease protein